MKQIEIRKFPTGYGWPIVELRQSPDELAAEKGVVFEDDLDDLGELKCAALWNPAVGQLYLEGRPHPIYKGVTIYIDGDVNRSQGVWAIEDELGLSTHDYEWVTESERSPLGKLTGVLRKHGPNGSHELSDREVEVANAVVDGRATRDIAKALRIAPSTVSGHLQRIYLKLGVHSRAELKEALRKFPHLAKSA